MDREIVDKLISIGVQRSDCTKLITLVDLIEANKKTPRVIIKEHEFYTPDGCITTKEVAFEMQTNKSKVPLSVLSSFGLKYEDIKLLQMVLEVLNTKVFIIENKDYFEPQLYPAEFYPEEYIKEILEEEQNNFLISLNGFKINLIREKLNSIKKELPENKGIITLYLEGNVLKYNMEGNILSCPFKEEQDPLIFLTKLILNHPKKLKNADFGKGMGKKPNWSRAKKVINKRVQKKLNLPIKPELIDNEDGYFINEKYKIL